MEVANTEHEARTEGPGVSEIFSKSLQEKIVLFL